MNIKIDWIYLLAAAFGTVGVIEYAKGFVKTVPSWIWRAILPVVCIGVAAAAGGGLYQIATNAVLILALSQLCYEAIIKAVKKKIEAIK